MIGLNIPLCSEKRLESHISFCFNFSITLTGPHVLQSTEFYKTFSEPKLDLLLGQPVYYRNTCYTEFIMIKKYPFLQTTIRLQYFIAGIAVKILLNPFFTDFSTKD